ncbi:5-hydroxyisourate hydrolase [Kiloniella litopenaei]|uniref:5-hydroxyisourate hydrolase n=1 Tax=Kiloniella litopenaei TaxID=1549748 RepID=A0A0M2RG75_9PROT|nr:hydroxyisourate hydrolase [Kiloniella litopenaei]KKJ78563.1 5-hydroxyisourate hydrolase [Kiloniella litopenaei]
MGRLTTHVLDTARGKPAKDLTIELWKHDGENVNFVKRVQTNDDGRANSPLLEDTEFTIGQYELRFMAGDYLKSQDHNLPDPLFLDIIPIRFGIADKDAHYHVPLLISPFGYSTYRGS